MAAITNATGTQFPFTIVEGQVMPLQPVPDFFTRIGQTGTGVQIVATRGAESYLTGHSLFKDLASAKAFRDGIMAINGSRCKWDDPMGFSGNVLVKNVVATIRAGRYSGGGVTDATFRVEATMTLEAQS